MAYSQFDNVDRMRRLREIFEAALLQAGDERSAFVEQACAGEPELRRELDALLAAHQQASGFLQRPAAMIAAVMPASPPKSTSSMVGRRLGPYTLVSEIGQGGMGIVYLGHRADDAFQRDVAVKVVRAGHDGPEVIQRFEQERQILASLDHPNIARLLDGGTTDEGLPYFVMEYINGRPIDRHCEDNQLNVTQRIELFEAVCGAVAYAHRRNIVHRDIKPGNILVTEEKIVKLVDFGIAKVLGGSPEAKTLLQTRSGLHLLTPAYASPEQVRGDQVGMATDVYSLGVVLYELLTGHTPYKMKSRILHEVMRVICEEEPTRPSTAAGRDSHQDKVPTGQATRVSCVAAVEGGQGPLKRRLAGDLDAIILRALRKQPDMRYKSVPDFREDLSRHLNGAPVQANRVSWIYRTKSFMKRHSNATLGAAIIGGLLAGQMVTINLLGGFMIAAGLVFIAGSYLAARLIYGESVPPGHTRRIALIYGCTMIVFTPVFRHLSRGDLNTFLLVGNFILFAGFLQLLARWPLRARWAGPLVGEFRSAIPTPTSAYRLIAAIILLCGITAIVLSENMVVRLSRTLALAWQLCLFLGISQFAGRLEIRQRGLIVSGRFLPWRLLVSHAWQHGENQTDVLKFELKSFARWFLPREIPLRREDRSAVDIILTSKLSPWPEHP